MNGKQGSRREFMLGTARGLGGAAVAGAAWTWVVHDQARAAPYALRPPGALAEAEFRGKCIKCGQCVADCPYDTLELADVGAPYPIGTPYFEPREVPCYMCPDLPCVRACPTGALDPALVRVDEADMGLAVLADQENCLSYRGLRCEICHRECPVQNRAITIENHSRGLSKHAVFVPVVHSDSCTGCGVCERACPLPEPAIRVFPRELAQGRLGDHYEFGWQSETPLTERFEPADRTPGEPADALDKGLDYLNSEELP